MDFLQSSHLILWNPEWCLLSDFERKVEHSSGYYYSNRSVPIWLNRVVECGGRRESATNQTSGLQRPTSTSPPSDGILSVEMFFKWKRVCSKRKEKHYLLECCMKSCCNLEFFALRVLWIHLKLVQSVVEVILLLNKQKKESWDIFPNFSE